MLLSLIYFLPCIVSLLWFVSFVLKQKNYRQRLFCYAEGTSAVFYALMGIYFFPDADYDSMVRMETICLPFGAMFPAFVVPYIYMHCTGKKMDDTLRFLLFVPSIVFAVAINICFYLSGFGRAVEVSRDYAARETLSGGLYTKLDQLYHFLTFDFFILVMGLFIAIISSLCIITMHRQGYRFGDVFRFFFRGRSTTNSRAIAVLALVQNVLVSILLSLSSIYFMKHVVGGVAFMIIFASIKHLIAHIEFYSNDEKPVTLYELSHLTLFNTVKDDREEKGVAADPAAAAPGTEPETVTPAMLKMNKRHELFVQLMEEKQVWRDEDLTASTLCDMMDIGKTTLSALVSQYYDSTFRDLVNKYRIEEAKRFMTSNPKATQETIAQHCGFKNAQYFNTQFKKIVGDTPAMWLAANLPDCEAPRTP